MTLNPRIWNRTMLVVLAGSFFLLAAELIMNFWESTSLCQSSGCYVASSMLGPIDSKWLVGLALVWVGLLFSLVRRNQSKLWWVFLALLFSGAVFEGVLLGTLLEAQIFCLLCFAVGGLVFLLLGLLSLAKPKIGLRGYALWITAIGISFVISQATIRPTEPLLFEASAAFTIKGEADPINGRDLHLFIRFDCPHCTKLLKAMADVEHFYGKWHIHITGNDMSMEAAQRTALASSLAQTDGLQGLIEAKTTPAEELPSISLLEYAHYKRKANDSYKQMARFAAFEVPFLLSRRPRQAIMVFDPVPIMSHLIANKALSEG